MLSFVFRGVASLRKSSSHLASQVSLFRGLVHEETKFLKLRQNKIRISHKLNNPDNNVLIIFF